jgi:hypothetical protein
MYGLFVVDFKGSAVAFPGKSICRYDNWLVEVNYNYGFNKATGLPWTWQRSSYSIWLLLSKVNIDRVNLFIIRCLSGISLSTNIFLRFLIVN